LGIDDSELKRCELGLVNEPEALVTAEIFIVMWKSMYDLVYHIESSRIAEKMLEKAIVLKCESDSDFKSNFTSIDKFIALDDTQLLEFMKGPQGLVSDLVKGIHDNKLYRKPYDELIKPVFSMNEKFLSELEKNSDDLSDKISIKLCQYAKCEKYEIICDIVKSRIPKPIHLDSYDEKTGDPIELKIKSDIISAIKEKIRIKVYTRSNLPKSVDKIFINKGLEEIICGWQ
jgi:HD superfamily phosphohydrolase